MCAKYAIGENVEYFFAQLQVIWRINSTLS